MIRAIVAIDDIRGIANSTQKPTIPWDIPNDRHYFRTTIAGGTVVMGRATYRTLSKPLPNCRNIVLSKSLGQVSTGFELLTDFAQVSENDDIWIIGGEQIYTSLLGQCDELYVTHVAGNFNCDRFFPEFENIYTLKNMSLWHEQNGERYRYAIYIKTGELQESAG